MHMIYNGVRPKHIWNKFSSDGTLSAAQCYWEVQPEILSSTSTKLKSHFKNWLSKKGWNHIHKRFESSTLRMKWKRTYDYNFKIFYNLKSTETLNAYIFKYIVEVYWGYLKKLLLLIILEKILLVFIFFSFGKEKRLPCYLVEMTPSTFFKLPAHRPNGKKINL